MEYRCHGRNKCHDTRCSIGYATVFLRLGVWVDSLVRHNFRAGPLCRMFDRDDEVFLYQAYANHSGLAYSVTHGCL